MTSRRTSHLTGRLGLLPALLAWVLWAAFAPGVMPVSGAAGPEMVLCTAAGPVPMQVPISGQDGHDERHADVGLCAFASAQAMSAMLSVALSLPAPQPLRGAGVRPVHSRVPAGLFVPAAQARAPPFLSPI